MPSSRRRREEEGEDPEEEAVDRRQRRKKKKGLFGKSGLTDADRRELRKDQRDLHRHILNGTSAAAKPAASAAAATAKDSDDSCDEEDDDQDVLDLEQGGGTQDAAAADAAASDKMAFLAQAREQNNDLFNKVRYPREAVLDAENVDLIANKYVQQSEQLLQAPRYDAFKLVDQLASKCSLEQDGQSIFDWRTLGQQCGLCFNSVPSGVMFLAGPLEAQAGSAASEQVARQKKKRTREKRDNVKEVRPDEVQEGDKDKKSDKAATVFDKTLGVMRKKLKKLTEAETKRIAEEVGEQEAKARIHAHGAPDLDGLHFLLHPNSFTQTVENLFLYSFLVKKGEAGIGVRRSSGEAEAALQEKEDDPLDLEGGGLYLQVTDPNSEAPATQAVASLTMADWRRLVEDTGGRPCQMPHRTGSGRGATQSQQAD